MDNQNFVGNDVAPVTAQDSVSEAGEQNVNPGAIRKSTTQSLLNALSNASGTQFQSVEDALAYMARVGAQNQNGGNAQPSGQPKQQNVQKVFCSVEKEIMPLVDKLLPIVRKKFSLSSQYSVMHVRRGDYDTAEFSPIIIGTLSDRYFINGLKEMDTSNLILLTENREDVRDLVKVLNPRMILDKFDTTPWETLAVMYGASQFLGANSSLSWWGARLCSANGGEVWLPSQWSYWKNIDPTDYHFPGIKIADVYWVQDNHLS